MGTKKLLNTSSSPPIAYKRYSNNTEEQTPLQQQHSTQQQQQQQQHRGHNRQSNSMNNTCLLERHNTNTMFTKLRNCFTQFCTKSTSALSASKKEYSHQQRKRHHRQHHRHEKLTECNSIPTVQGTSNILNIICITVTLVFLASINGVTSNPVFVDNPSLAQFQSGRNIRHLPCIVRKSGRSGVCMFAIDCIKQNGTHLGTCIDRFYFGSCCDIKEEELIEIADNSIDQNTISHHLTPDASTLPTSTLFKVTTNISPSYQQDNTSTIASSSISSTALSSSTASQDNTTQISNTVNQSLTTSPLRDTPKPSSVLTSSSTGKPTESTTTLKPSPQTTYKQSHFVIRTTAKPTNKYATGGKPSHNSTIKRKTPPSNTTKKVATSTSATTTTVTTTKRPILTTTFATQQRDELPAATTPPVKLFTYQIVETTVFTPTEATNTFDFATTERVQPNTVKVAQTITAQQNITTITNNEATPITTETDTTHKISTTKPKPQTTRKPPTTTKKPSSVKRTTTKPTRRPIAAIKSTTTPNTINDLKTQSSSTTEAILVVNKTTLASRPRPRPTANIVKVPKPNPTTSTKPTSAITATTIHASSSTEAEMLMPTKSTATSSTTKTTSTATTESTPTITTTSTTTTTSSSTTAATRTTTTTTPKTTATTTQKVTDTPIISSTTHKPGLVTWTDIDGEPVDPNKPIISDWIPVTSQAPLNTNNKVEESSSENVTFEEMDVSVSSSVSAVMNNTTIIIIPSQKPILAARPTTTTTSTSTTSAPTVATATTTLKPAIGPSSPTEQLAESVAVPSSEFASVAVSSSTTTSTSGVNTEELTTESLNLNSSTTNPIIGLEGVDYRQVCGRRMFPEPRIVGGSNAAFGRWPWQISLRQWRTSTYLHKCGAALLNENWAITAAHCVDNVPPSDLLLRLGEYDLAEEEEPYSYQERRVQIVASHPQFDPRTFEYDLALLRFYEPVVFQPNIIPVCVPENDENFIGQTAFVTGWGRLYEDGPLPSVLQEVAVPVINNTICESMYRAAGYIEHIPHIFICAGWKKGGYDSCEGDSGGPMVLQREIDKRFQLGGVISWGIGCAEANQPGVYTRISEFRDWINQILQF